MKRLLELFSGTHSVGKVVKDDYEITSLDIELGDDDNISNTHIEEDIFTWNYKIYPPGHFDVIWASPVCCWWSQLIFCNIGRPVAKHGGRILTREDIENDIIKYGIPMVEKVFEIIDYFKPKYYFIENPQSGRMKEYITYLPYYDVDYCKYSDWGYRKRTRIWTNIEGFNNLLCKKDCPNMNGNKHKLNVTEMSSCGMGKNNPRYRIPPNLIKDLFKLC